jgi:hypothetical protein
MEQERLFLELLDRVDRYIIEGADRLRLLDENGEVVIDLESTTTPPEGVL